MASSRQENNCDHKVLMPQDAILKTLGHSGVLSPQGDGPRSLEDGRAGDEIQLGTERQPAIKPGSTALVPRPPGDDRAPRTASPPKALRRRTRRLDAARLEAHAAGDLQYLAGDVIGIRRAEHVDGACRLLCCALASQRDRCAKTG